MVLEIEPMDLGNEIRATGLELLDGADREPVAGNEAAHVWSKIVPTLAGQEPWAFDFCSSVDRVRAFCESKSVRFHEVSRKLLVVTPVTAASSKELLERLSQETFGIRAGTRVELPDADLEGELARRGFDAYQTAYEHYFLCGICDLASGSLVVLSRALWATEIARRMRPALTDVGIQIQTAR